MIEAGSAWHRQWKPWELASLVALTALLCTRGLDGGDLEIFLQAGERAANGEPVYGIWLPRHDGEALQYYYGPVFAGLIAPLAYLPMAAAVVIWQLLRTAALFRSWWLLLGQFGMAGVDRRNASVLLAGTTLIAGRALLLDFDMAQITVIMVWACLESVAGFRRGGLLWPALLLALAIMIKVLPVVLLPYLLFRGQWRALGLTVAAMLLYVVLPALWWGWSTDLALHEAWSISVDPFGEEHALETSLGMHGLAAMVPAYLMKLPSEVSLRRHLLDLDATTVLIVLNAVRLLLIGSVLLFMRRPFFKGWGTPTRDLSELAYILLLVPLLFPHQQKYAFALVLPAACWAVQVWWRVRSTSLLVTLAASAVLLTFTSDLFIGTGLSRITQHYKLMTMGALLLVVAMWLARSFSRHEEPIAP